VAAFASGFSPGTVPKKMRMELIAAAPDTGDPVFSPCPDNRKA
jgi:hypothetical protein